MNYALRNTRATLDITFSAGNADTGVTVTVTDANGTAVASGSATQQTDPGHYTFTLDPQPDVAWLTLVWAGTFSAAAQSITSYAEVVGNHLFALAELRAFGDKAVADTTAYPDATLRAARDEITEFFERVCGVSFIPRYGHDTLDGENTTDLWLTKRHVNRVITAKVNDIALTIDQLADVYVYPEGHLYRSSGWVSRLRHGNILVEYEHGYKDPPAEIKRAALTLARYQLVATDLSDRMVTFSNELGTTRLSVPGAEYPTGIPIVDVALDRYSERLLVV